MGIFGLMVWLLIWRIILSLEEKYFVEVVSVDFS